MGYISGRARAVGSLYAMVATAATTLMVTGCRAPTEMTFVLSSDVPCDRVTGVSIAVGTGGDVDTSAVATTTHECTGAGDLGSIVTVPSGSKTDPMSIKITVGVGRDPLECQPPNFGTGCIVARRSLRYLPHTPLTLDVALTAACNGVVCAPTETCVRGACTGAEIADPNACAGGCAEGALTTSTNKPQVPSPLVCGDMSGLQPGAQWPMQGYCPTRVGRSPRVGAQTSAVRWTVSVGVPIRSGISISADGTIYFGANDSKLYAASPTGQLKWSSLTGGAFSETVGAIGHDGTVYMGNDDTNLYAFDPGGGVKWKYKVGGTLRTAPNVGADGSIFVGGGIGQSSAVGLDPKGNLRWTFPTKGEVWSSPTLALDGTVLFGAEDQNLYGLKQDGTVNFSWFAAEPLQTPVVGDNGWIYLNGKPSICALDANHNLLWKTSTDGNATIPALAADGTVYAGSTSGKVYAFDSKGTVKWMTALTPFNEWTQPILGLDGLIYIGATDGTFYALMPDGSVKWKLATGAGIFGAAAMGADGTIYFGASDGKLYAVGP